MYPSSHLKVFIALPLVKTIMKSGLVFTFGDKMWVDVHILSVIGGTRPQVIKLLACSIQLSMKFSLLMKMKMPTNVGIFIFISRENFTLSFAEQENNCTYQ